MDARSNVERIRREPGARLVERFFVARGPAGGWRPESGFATTVSAHVAADQKVPVLLLTMRREGGRAATGFLAQRSGLDPRRL